jgi:superfamily II DNA or RNA helicase
MILLLRPLPYFGLVSADLKRADTSGKYIDILGRQRRDQLNDADEIFQQLAGLCEELLPDSLYAKYANKSVYKRSELFWNNADEQVKSYVKRMSDMRLLKVLQLAASQDVPVYYQSSDKGLLKLTDRLHLNEEAAVTPVMSFERRADGISYRLQLRIGNDLSGILSERSLVVLGYSPGIFVLDGIIYVMGQDFSAKLLLPFRTKAVVEIPRRTENDYFRRFIIKHVTRAEVNAEGFDIDDIKEHLCPKLTLGKSIDGKSVLMLRFQYGSTEYTFTNKTLGRVTLQQAGDGFRFIRQLRDKAEEQQKTELLLQTGIQLTSYGDIRFDSLSDMIDWLRQFAPALRQQGFEVVQPSDKVYYIGPLSVEQSETWHGDWLQTDVTIVLDDGRLRIPFRDLRDTILRGEQDYMLPTGERLLIPMEWLQRYNDLLLIGMPRGQGFQRHRSQLPQDEVASVCPAGCADAVSVPAALNATLRPYQTAGFEWLWRNFLAQTGCCLSDEMGLGKTLQTIALLLKYREVAKTDKRPPSPGMLFSEEEMKGVADQHAGGLALDYKPSLVVAPASVVYNWRNELQRFAPTLSVCAYTGDTGRRRNMRAMLKSCDVMLISYNTLLNDIDFLEKMAFGIAVFDESQMFKNHASQTHKAVSRVKALHRQALSGTPVENNLGELWSLMNVLNPQLLGDAHSFWQAFVRPATKETLGSSKNPIARQMESGRQSLLSRLIAPYFLKRTKEEVLGDLPERQDEVVVCTMTDEQASNYASELSKARNEWMDTADPGRQIHILAAIQRLRNIANGEGKMNAVFEHLENLRGTRHKVLLFSEYVTLLEQVGAEMQHRGWQYDLLTGKTQQREQVIAHFQQTEACQFFLISLKAGGVGLNLTAADYVFLLDPWWNLAAEEQAIARAHRIGQHHPVFVYRFVSANTLEEQILTLQERKQTLIDSVMPFITREA